MMTLYDVLQDREDITGSENQHCHNTDESGFAGP